MQYTEWKQKKFEHLTFYKEHELHIFDKVEENGHSYSHILDSANGDKNYLNDSVIKFANNLDKKHTKWNHLNSSQTMCLNFFVPLIENYYKLLNSLLNEITDNDNINIVSCEFEHKCIAEKNLQNLTFGVLIIKSVITISK